MANGWTTERRSRQAELIRNWKPWKQSTGPRTQVGKSKSARNGDRGGAWKVDRDKLRALKATVNDLLRQQRDLLRRVSE